MESPELAELKPIGSVQRFEPLGIETVGNPREIAKRGRQKENDAGRCFIKKKWWVLLNRLR